MMALMCSLLLASSALAVTTYAWFATNHIVSATGMTVSAKSQEPLSLQLYYYNGNFADDPNYANPTKAPHGYLSASSFSGTFASNFTAVSGDNDYQTSSAGLYPGRKLTYAVVVGNGGDSSLSIGCSITDFDSDPGNSYIAESEDEPILLSYAIDVHCDYCPYNAVNTYVVNYMTNDYIPALSHSSQYDANGAKDLFNVNTANPGTIDLLSNASLGTEGMVIFFTVIFSDASSTYYSYVSTTSNKNYYEKTVSGDSNCYMSLSFQLKEMLVG
ncbi:MAG: hypothetical protein V3G53_03725 [Candidatus Enteromonas sp.]|jgi:hypothetical protein